MLLATAVLQGVIAGGFIQTATYKRNLALKNKFGVGFMILFLLLAFNIGYDGGAARYLAFAGAVLVVASQKIVFGDRKRGDYWMAHGEVNPNPVVYSLGEPLFTLGWVLLAWSMSLPML